MILALIIQTLFNLLNAGYDAWRFNTGRKPMHWLNFLLYLIIIGLSCWYCFTGNIVQVALLAISALCNRQLFFDIPLNWRRGLRWDYVSPERASFIDRIEYSVFGNNGQAPVVVYLLVWVLSTGVMFLI